MSHARFELYVDERDEWRWRLVHDNGNIIADSGEGYDRRQVPAMASRASNRTLQTRQSSKNNSPKQPVYHNSYRMPVTLSEDLQGGAQGALV
jgi:uncharacterized protein YegP (UPF0339 family)